MELCFGVPAEEQSVEEHQREQDAARGDQSERRAEGWGMHVWDGGVVGALHGMLYFGVGMKRLRNARDAKFR